MYRSSSVKYTGEHIIQNNIQADAEIECAQNVIHMEKHGNAHKCTVVAAVAVHHASKPVEE